MQEALTFFVCIHETQVPGCVPACIVPGPQMRPEALDFVAEAFKWVQIGDGMGACAVGRGAHAHVQGEATLTMCSLGRLEEAESSGDQDSLITITDLLKQKWSRDSGVFLAFVEQTTALPACQGSVDDPESQVPKPAFTKATARAPCLPRYM